MDSIKETIAAMAKAARQASQAMTRVTSGQKNQALQAMADDGVGLVNYGAADIRRIMGLRSQHISQVLGHKPYDEVIHRDNLVITVEDGGEEG